MKKKLLGISLGILLLSTPLLIAGGFFGTGGGGGGGSWGSITGTLSDQTDVQSALDAKAPKDSPTFTTKTTHSYATASTLPVWNGSKELVSSAVTGTEAGYLSGVTSAIQTQLNTKTSAIGNDFAIAYTGNGHGSTNTDIRKYSSNSSAGSSITYATSASAGASFTINATGIYSITMKDTRSGGTAEFGASKNSANLSTSIINLTPLTEALFWSDSSVANSYASWSGTFYLTSGDVVRPHDDGSPNDTFTFGAVFLIRRIE